uniref:Uncharacterized protein n=1 Tax=Glossina pallidipes TaxID=7398 RepID=A0A1A9ZWZ6_GLOPL
MFKQLMRGGRLNNKVIQVVLLCLDGALDTQSDHSSSLLELHSLLFAAGGTSFKVEVLDLKKDEMNASCSEHKTQELTHHRPIPYQMLSRTMV